MLRQSRDDLVGAISSVPAATSGEGAGVEKSIKEFRAVASVLQSETIILLNLLTTLDLKRESQMMRHQRRCEEIALSESASMIERLDGLVRLADGIQRSRRNIRNLRWLSSMSSKKSRDS